jgi:hypothetical protein
MQQLFTPAEDAEASMAEWVGLGEWVQSMAYPHSLIERDVVRLLQLLQELDINQVDRLLDRSLALDPTGVTHELDLYRLLKKDTKPASPDGHKPTMELL